MCELLCFMSFRQGSDNVKPLAIKIGCIPTVNSPYKLDFDYSAGKWLAGRKISMKAMETL